MSGKVFLSDCWKRARNICSGSVLILLLGLTACAAGNEEGAPESGTPQKDMVRFREGVKSFPVSVAFPLSCMSRKAQFTIRLPAPREGDGYKWVCLIPETSGITLLSRKFIPPRWDEKQQASFSGCEEFLFLASRSVEATLHFSYQQAAKGTFETRSVPVMILLSEEETAKARERFSPMHLKKLMAATLMYAADHKDRLPDSPEDLRKNKYLPDSAVNCSSVTGKPYLYFGKDVLMSKIKNPAAYPIYLSPPDPAEQSVSAAFLDGHVQILPLGAPYENVSQVFDWLRKNKGLDAETCHKLQQSIAPQAVKP